jgi:hypothetical protein
MADDSGLGAGTHRNPAERTSRRRRTNGGRPHRRAGPIDGGREDANQAAQPDGRQVAAPDHRANGLLVTPEPAGGVGDG